MKDEPRPTVGRIVHVRTGAGRCLPAIVTAAGEYPDDPDRIDLTVFDRARTYTSEDPAPDFDGVEWHWPER